MSSWGYIALSLLSYAFMGLTLGYVYKLLALTRLFDKIKAAPLLVATRILVGLAMLYPIWNFLFGFVGGDIGFAPTINLGWVVTIGVGIAITAFFSINSNKL